MTEWCCNVQATFGMDILDSGHVNAFCGFFDVSFKGSPESPADFEVQLSTAPDPRGSTHWGQQLFALQPAIQCHRGAALALVWTDAAHAVFLAAGTSHTGMHPAWVCGYSLSSCRRCNTSIPLLGSRGHTSHLQDSQPAKINLQASLSLQGTRYGGTCAWCGGRRTTGSWRCTSATTWPATRCLLPPA